MAHAKGDASPDMRLHWRAAVAIAVAGVVALGLAGALGAAGDNRPRPVRLSQEAPPSTTTSTAPAPAADTIAADSVLASPPPAEPEPAPTAAGPTTTATTGRPPARNVPRPTTATTAAGTVESRGAAALALIDYPWPRTGYAIVFAGPNDNLLGLTEPSRKRITVYLRPTQSTTDVARIIGHEIGHAVDFTMTSDAERADYRRIRGLDDRAWYPCGSCPDYASPAGDWAETFAYWLLGNGSFNSQLAGKPTSAQLTALTPIFTADTPATSTTTTTRLSTAPAPKPATTPTTTAGPGGTTAPGYGYGGGYRRGRRH